MGYTWATHGLQQNACGPDKGDAQGNSLGNAVATQQCHSITKMTVCTRGCQDPH